MAGQGQRHTGQQKSLAGPLSSQPRAQERQDFHYAWPHFLQAPEEPSGLFPLPLIRQSGLFVETS